MTFARFVVQYLPYGEIRWGDTGPTDFGFTGQRNDRYIKLTQMGARWYDSQLGRFISPDTIIPDPMNPQSLNRYSYVYGNPVKFTDPTGHFPWLIPVLIGVALMVSSDMPMNDEVVAAEAAAGRTDYRDTYPSDTQGFIGLGLLASPIAGLGVQEAAAACIATNCAQKAPQWLQKSVEWLAGDGDPTNELNKAVNIGTKAIEATTKMEKVASQLQSKTNLLNIKVSGDMQSLNNPQVQKALTQLNNVTTNPDRIWSGTWKGQQVYEYIQGNVGVVRDQATGELLTVLERTDLSKLEKFVENGTAQWLK